MLDDPLKPLKKTAPLMGSSLDHLLAASLGQANNYIDPIKEENSFRKKERYAILAARDKNISKNYTNK